MTIFYELFLEPQEKLLNWSNKIFNFFSMFKLVLAIKTQEWKKFHKKKTKRYENDVQIQEKPTCLQKLRQELPMNFVPSQKDTNTSRHWMKGNVTSRYGTKMATNSQLVNIPIFCRTIKVHFQTTIQLSRFIKTYFLVFFMHESVCLILFL